MPSLWPPFLPSCGPSNGPPSPCRSPLAAAVLVAAVAAVVTALVTAVVSTGSLVAAEQAAEQADGGSSTAASPKDVRDLLDAAAKLLAEGRPGKAADVAAEAAKGIEQLANQDKPPAGLRSLWDRCRSLRDDIALEGVDVARIALAPLRAAGPKGAAARPGTPAAMPPVRQAAASAMGFSRQVAPILVRHCGGCHIAGRKGGFQMASYAGLMKTGVVQPGVGEASRLVEVILSGDMPRGGGKVSPEDVAILTKWIDAGAPFDGPDPEASIDLITRQATAAAPATAAAVAATPSKPAKGGVSFAADVAPVLLEHCAGCHDATNPESNLSMATLERLSRGGRGGAPFLAGKGADSLLVKKIKGGGGIEGQRMPLGKDPLPDAVIAKIQAWIDQGAAIDMLTPKDDLAAVASAGRARTLSHESLRPVRFEAGRRLWSRAIPDERPTVTDRGDVRVVGNLSGPRLESLAGRAEEVARRLQDDMAGGSVILKGGMVVYAFAKPYDFSSFWQTVFSDERPKGVTSGAGVSGDVAYAAIIAGGDDTEAADVTATLTEQMAAAALLGRGAPAWFARGAGRALATKAAPKAAVVQAWRRQVPEAVARMGSVADVMAGRGDPEIAAGAAGGFVTTLAGGPRLPALVKQLDEGVAFEQAFQRVYRTAAQAAFEAWCGQQSRAGRK